jgi:protoheme ferro-lyase
MTDDRPIGVLVMAYGTADGPDDIERYYTDIRGGRAPSPVSGSPSTRPLW